MENLGLPRRPVAALLALAVLLAVPALTGCLPEDATPPTPTRPEVPDLGLSPPSRPDATAETVDWAQVARTDPLGTGLTGTDLEAFLAARYEAYWDVYDQARSHPPAVVGEGGSVPDPPELVALATGEQLDASRDALARLAAGSQAVREAELPAIAGTDADTEHRVRVASVDGALAELEVCMVNDDVVVSTADGSVLSAEVWTVESRATMARTAEGWKLLRSRAVDLVDGVTGCWLSGDDRYPY